MPKQFTLGRKERLKSRKQIEQLFSNGQRFGVPLFRVFFSFQVERRVESAESLLQAGFGASSRNFKTAVDRNRIKRLSREAYRLQKRDLQVLATDLAIPLSVFFIYTGKELPDYTAVKQNIGQALIKLEDILKKRK